MKEYTTDEIEFGTCQSCGEYHMLACVDAGMRGELWICSHCESTGEQFN